MNKKFSGDPFESVYAYLKVITIAGGLATASLPLVIQSVVDLSLKDQISVIPDQPVRHEPFTLPEIVIEGFIPAQNIRTTVPADDPLTISRKLASESQNSSVVYHQSESDFHLAEVSTIETAGAEDTMLAEVPGAIVDVFPNGYGSFKIIIQTAVDGNFEAALFDVAGNEIVSETYDVYIGENTFVLESGSIPQGEYLLKVSNGIMTSEKRVRLK